MRRHWITLSLLTVAGISFAVMQTLVIPALPFFRREFGTSQADTTWLVTGFLLSSSVLTPLLGKLGDMYGKKRLMVVCLAIFGARLAGRRRGRLAGLARRLPRRAGRRRRRVPAGLRDHPRRVPAPSGSGVAIGVDVVACSAWAAGSAWSAAASCWRA